MVFRHRGFVQADGSCFEDSYKSDRPIEMVYGQAPKRLQAGMPGMRVGGIRRLIVPPALAFAERGVPKEEGEGYKVPPNATIVYEIELVELRQRLPGLLREDLVMPRSSCNGDFLRFDHPAAAHCLVEIDHRLQLALLGLRVLQLDIEQATFRIQDFNIAGVDVFVAQPCRPRILLQSPHLTFLRLQLGTRAVLVDQRVIDFAKGLLDGPLIREQRLLLLRFRRLHLTGYGTGRKDRHADRRGVLPDLRLAVEEIAQAAAGVTEQAGQRNGRKVSGLGRANQGVCGNQALFRLLDVWPSLKNIRG